MPTKPLRVANIEHDLAVYRVEEYADHYRVKVATQIDAVVQKDSRIITGQGARLYAVRIRKVVEKYLHEKEMAK